MTEKFNLSQMRKEILEDEKLSHKQTKAAVSQDQIATMMRARKARRKQNVTKNH